MEHVLHLYSTVKMCDLVTHAWFLCTCFDTDLVLKTEQKPCTLFWVDFFIEYRHCIQVCVGYQSAKNYMHEMVLEWCMMDVYTLNQLLYILKMKSYWWQNYQDE